MKNKKLLYLILPVITLILEILPYGAVCNFASPDGTSKRKTYSYFDLTPYGYANFAPFITALITCVILALLLIYQVNKKHSLLTVVKTLLAICSVVSLGPLLLGVQYLSAVGIIITVTLVAEYVLIALSSHKIT